MPKQPVSPTGDCSPAGATSDPPADWASAPPLGEGAPTTGLPAIAVPTVGVGLVGLGSVLIALLHVLPPSNQVDPMTRTLSQYALGGNGWMFDLGVLALAVGSVAILAGLVRAGVVRALSGATVFVALWSGALAVLVFFQKYDFANGEHTGASGMIHRMASLVAFLSLPLAAMLTVRYAGRRNPGWRRPAAWTRWATVASWACLSLLLYAIAQSFFTDITWWRLFPLGALERLIALSEILAVLALGNWARKASDGPAGSAALADPVGDGASGAALVQ